MALSAAVAVSAAVAAGSGDGGGAGGLAGAKEVTAFGRCKYTVETSLVS